MDYYTLDEDHVVHGPFEFTDWIEFARRIENQLEFNKVCRVGRTQIDGDCWVSTIFLRGVNHQWFPNGPPLLFETMIFGGEHGQYQMRYTTWDRAVAGHQVAVNLAMGVPIGGDNDQ